MKKNIKTLAALLIASATFVACSSDNDIISENQQPANGKYTMTINASKGDGATTRALTIDDSGVKNVLNATWATTENVYVQKGSTWATGSLQLQADGATATLKGELSVIDIEPGDVLTLQFPKSGAISYAGQVGTLADIAANFDYATATVEVASVSATGNITPKAATTTFTNLQAIVKFTLIDKADGTTSLNAKPLVVSVGSTDYTITPASATSEIYVAIPGISGQTVTLTATVGDDTYTYEKSGVTFTNGKYYEITVKMTKQAPAAKAAADATAEDIGKIVGADGYIYDTKDAAEAVATGNAIAMIAYVGTASDCAHGLAIALENVSGSYTWGDAEGAVTTWASGKTPPTTGSWRLPSIKDWQYMIIGCEGSGSYSDNPWSMSYNGLREKLAAAGGTALDAPALDTLYWSSTESENRPDRNAWGPNFYDYDGNAYFYNNNRKSDDHPVRACLAF